jgi:hypothetical protein
MLRTKKQRHGMAQEFKRQGKKPVCFRERFLSILMISNRHRVHITAADTRAYIQIAGWLIQNVRLWPYDMSSTVHPVTILRVGKFDEQI